jgi:hypothetical protein
VRVDYRRVHKVNGYASKKEAQMASDLRLLASAGHIQELKEQVKFELIPKQPGERACSYIADFTYWQDGQFVVMDTKGFRTEVYKIKKKLLLWVHKIRITEA